MKCHAGPSFSFFFKVSQHLKSFFASPLPSSGSKAYMQLNSGLKMKVALGVAPIKPDISIDFFFWFFFFRVPQCTAGWGGPERFFFGFIYSLPQSGKTKHSRESRLPKPNSSCPSWSSRQTTKENGSSELTTPQCWAVTGNILKSTVTVEILFKCLPLQTFCRLACSI